MKQKLLFILLLFLTCLLIISTLSYANEFKDDMQNATNSIMDGAQSIGNEVKSSLDSAGNEISNSANKTQNSISHGVNSMESILSGNSIMSNTTGYNAERTATEITDADIANSNLWTWVALAVAGAVIIGLVWYYAQEREGR